MSNVLKVSHQEANRSLHEKGWSQRRIARELGINGRTVRGYIVAPLTRIDVSILVCNSAGILDDLSFLSDDLVNSWVEVVRIEGIAAEVVDEKIPCSEDAKPRQDDRSLPNAPHLLTAWYRSSQSSWF